MNRFGRSAALAAIAVIANPSLIVIARPTEASRPSGAIQIVGLPVLFGLDIASTQYAEIRLTLSPDGRTALWFSRDRPGGSGGYDIWMSKRTAAGWQAAAPVSFNSATRDFDPAFSADGAYVYFCSDRLGGHGGDDIYRVRVTAKGFSRPENLGASVNSSGAEFAPMLSRDSTTLLFSSDRAGGAGGHDLFTARRVGRSFASAQRLAGPVNSVANEFDATFVDADTIIFARTPDFSSGRVDLYSSRRTTDGWGIGARLPNTVNDPTRNTYGTMVDWSQPARLLFSARRYEARGMDLYSVGFRTVRRPVPSHPKARGK